MKENKYDNEVFFKKYSEMDRSKKGLDGAGEWQTLEKMLPDFLNKRVLDLGCGYGWHCRYASEHGAAEVIGIDISQKMIDEANSKNSGSNIKYIKCSIEDIDFPKESFDCVISSLAFHYVKDFDEVVKKVCSYLKGSGHFVFSAEHPIFTAYGTQDWVYAKSGEILYFPVDNYFMEGQRDTLFLGEHVVKYHRTLDTYLNTLLENGFLIKEIREPMPPEEMMDIPGMKDELRRPMMIIVSAVKSND